MSEIVVEPPERDDVEELTDLWVELAGSQQAFGTHLLAEENEQNARETVLQQLLTDACRVARADGSIVGFVTFGEDSEGYAQDVTRGFVHNLYVTSAYRNRGIGSKLLAAAERALRERGAEAIALQVMAPNEAARRFYRRHGYEPHRIEFEKSTGSDNLTPDDE